MFEEVDGTLLCSDLLQQNGDHEASTTSSVVGQMRQMLIDYHKGPLAYYMPYTQHTDRILREVADLSPNRELQDMAAMMKATIGS